MFYVTGTVPGDESNKQSKVKVVRVLFLITAL